MKRNKRILIKYLALMLVLVSALLLSACRTRITNNNEVSNIHYDESGYLSETYQMHRDELGLSTAKKPLLPDFGSVEDEQEDYNNSESIDYEPEPEEPYVEPPEVRDSNNTTNTTSDRTTRRTTNRGSGSDNRTYERVTVKFDPNGGKCDTESKQVYKGRRIGSLPEATKDGKTTRKWTTAKNGGSEVKRDTIINEDVTIYAYWDSGEEKEKEKITITFNANGGKNPPSSRTVEEGATYGDIANLKENMTYEGYTFTGWSTSPKNGKIIKSADKVPTGNKKLTLYAQWSANPVKLTLDAQGGTNGGVHTLNKGDKFTLPASERTGLIFKCWKDESGNTYVAGHKYTVDENTTLTAQWENAYDYWNAEYGKRTSKIEDKDKVEAMILDGDIDDGGILNALIKPPAGDKYPVICFVDNDKIDGKYNELRETYEVVYVISSDSVKDSDSNNILAYQIDMYNRLINKDPLDSQKAAKDLGVTVNIRNKDD